MSSLGQSRSCRMISGRLYGTPKERARLTLIGRMPPFADGQIAAVAATNGLSLVTFNRDDYACFSRPAAGRLAQDLRVGNQMPEFGYLRRAENSAPAAGPDPGTRPLPRGRNRPPHRRCSAAAMRQMNLSARTYHRVLKLARTIADLAGSERAPALATARCIEPCQRDRTAVLVGQFSGSSAKFILLGAGGRHRWLDEVGGVADGRSTFHHGSIRFSRRHTWAGKRTPSADAPAQTTAHPWPGGRFRLSKMT